PQEVSVILAGMEPANVKGRVLQGRGIGSHNTFERPGEVMPSGFNGFRVRDGRIQGVLPACSVVVLEIR
ncbi:MAG: alpha-N-arabinofuranosidase, partial [Bacteroidetes bacterium]